MSFISHFIFQSFSNALALLAADYFIKDFIFKGNFIELIIAAFIFTLINVTLRPILKLILGPLIVLTFGLFSFFINVVILYLLDIFIENLIIEGYLALIFATFIITLANLIINLSAKKALKK